MCEGRHSLTDCFNIASCAEGSFGSADGDEWQRFKGNNCWIIRRRLHYPKFTGTTNLRSITFPLDWSKNWYGRLNIFGSWRSHRVAVSKGASDILFNSKKTLQPMTFHTRLKDNSRFYYISVIVARLASWWEYAAETTTTILEDFLPSNEANIASFVTDGALHAGRL